MKKVINRFQYIDCTAIAISAGDSVRQGSVLIRDLEATAGDADSILFGWNVADIPDDAEEMADFLSDEYPSGDDDDLATVEVEGLSLVEYVSGQL